MTSVLSDSDVKIWIEPLRFEIGDAQPVLRFPNQFFMNWVKKHYEPSLAEAFRQHGLSEPKFELFTESQLQALERRQTEEALAALAGTEAKASRPETAEEDVEALSLEDQYARLYQAYPRRECRENGWKVFSRLHRANRLPKISKLIRAVNRAKSENQSWQRENGRYAPQIHKWLLERRWMD